MKCEICGRECKNWISFSAHIVRKHNITTRYYYDKYLKKDEKEGICYCGNPINFYRIKTGYQKYCGRKCSNRSEEVKGKKIQTCLENFGVKYSFQSEEVKEKIEQTSLKNHGVKNPMQCKEISQKITGGNHGNWLGDREQRFAPYTESFHDEEFRKKIRNEQNNLDLITNELLEDNAHLHHIDYNKQNDSRNNLIFLNSSTHIKTNFNREKWKIKLTEINGRFKCQLV